MNWDSVKVWLIPIDNVAKYKSKWICVCNSCQNERLVSYGQARNLLIGVNKRKCRECQVNSGEIIYNIDGLKHGRKFNGKSGSNKSKKLSKLLEFRNLFNNPTNDPNTIVKMKESRKKIPLGEKQSNWQGGKTSEQKKLRGSLEYQQLRKSVFKRDNFTCQLCSKRGSIDLEMDHVKEWCNYPELRFDMNNCRTLCKHCHTTTDNYKHKAVQKRRQLCQ